MTGKLFSGIRMGSSKWLPWRRWHSFCSCSGRMPFACRLITGTFVHEITGEMLLTGEQDAL
jgi:hypothetical protein